MLGRRVGACVALMLALPLHIDTDYILLLLIIIACIIKFNFISLQVNEVNLI